MIRMKKCKLNTIHIVRFVCPDTTNRVLRAEFTLFDNGDTGEGCSGDTAGPWPAEVMKKLDELHELMEKTLKTRFSGEEEDDGSRDRDSSGGSVRGIPGGLRTELGGGEDPIKQV